MPSMLSGLSILTPAAWWALLALAIPLLIHLFSRSRGRLVYTGHIDLVRQARRVKVTELRLTQRLLLMVRLGIFTLAALILAGLATTGRENGPEPVVYLTPGWVQSASAPEKEAVIRDAESRPETRLVLLQPGFPEVDRAALETPAQPASPIPNDQGETWTLLAERLSAAGHAGPVTVYATDRLMQFGRDKPALPAGISWRTTHPPAAAAPDPAKIRALITYDPERAGDARLLEAALAALKAQRLPGLLWESAELDKRHAAASGYDWLIRLGNGGAESNEINRTGPPLVILSDAIDAGEEVPEQMLNLPFYPFSQFRVNRLGHDPAMAPGHAGPADWRVVISTRELAPVLQESRAGRTRVVQFNSRFNPDWSSLAQQPEFPELLLQLMLEPGHDFQRFADARIDPSGLSRSAQASVAEIPLPRHSLQQLLATLLVILWVTERWLSEKRSREGR
jgi:hypothetical protein